MNALNLVFRPWLAGFALAGTALLSGQALAATASAPPITSITTPLTAPLSVLGGRETDLTHVRGTFNPTWLNGESTYSSVFDLTEMTRGGQLLLTEAAARVTFTLVGQESGLNNTFTAGGLTLSNFTHGKKGGHGDKGGQGGGHLSNLGASFSFENVAAGLLNFGFLSNGAGALRGNGHAATGLMLADDHRSALILFNDRGGDRDFDDMVVKLSVSPVPEPQTYAMLLGGLGLLGLMARRRQRRGG